MAIHIGKIIKKLVKKKGFGVPEFAKEINYSRRNVYEIFERETIDTGLLIKVSKVLGENLFLHYITEEEISSFKDSKSTKEDLKEILSDLRVEVKRLRDSNVTIKKKETTKASFK
jgi:hypothetical protein